MIFTFLNADSVKTAEADLIEDENEKSRTKKKYKLAMILICSWQLILAGFFIEQLKTGKRKKMDYREYLKDFIGRLGYGTHTDASSVFKIQYVYKSEKEEAKLLDRQLSKIVKVHDDFVLIQSEIRSRRQGSRYLTFSSTTAMPISRVIVSEVTKEDQ